MAKIGDRFAALQPVYDAVLDRWGRLAADIARGLELRHDWDRSIAQRISPARHSPGQEPPRAWLVRWGRLGRCAMPPSISH